MSGTSTVAPGLIAIGLWSSLSSEKLLALEIVGTNSRVLSVGFVSEIVCCVHLQIINNTTHVSHVYVSEMKVIQFCLKQPEEGFENRKKTVFKSTDQESHSQKQWKQYFEKNLNYNAENRSCANMNFIREDHLYRGISVSQTIYKLRQNKVSI